MADPTTARPTGTQPKSSLCQRIGHTFDYHLDDFVKPADEEGGTPAHVRAVSFLAIVMMLLISIAANLESPPPGAYPGRKSPTLVPTLALVSAVLLSMLLLGILFKTMTATTRKGRYGSFATSF